MPRYYCESNFNEVKIFKEVTAGAFKNRVKQNKPVFEATEEELRQLANDFKSYGKLVKIIEK